MWNHKGPQITKANLRKKKKPGGMIFSDFKIYCKAKVIKQYVINQQNSLA